VRRASSSYGRVRRTLEVKQGSSCWVDVQQVLLREGHALWMPPPASLGESAHNAGYRLASQQAAAAAGAGAGAGAGKSLWDTDSCGAGPFQTARLALDVASDAEGDDTTNVNGEWVRIRNTGTTAVHLKAWSLRTASWDVHRFTATTRIEPGGSITVQSGRAPARVAAGHHDVG